MKVKDIYAKHNLHIQEATFSCGPCSILNVLQAKGDFSRTEPELIKLCGAKPGVGSSNAGVVRGAEAVGLKIVQQKRNASMRDIARNLDAGAFVIVNYWEPFCREGHYGVITEHDDKSFYLRDPYLGFLRIRKKYFTRLWHNTDGSVRRWFLAVK